MNASPAKPLRTLRFAFLCCRRQAWLIALVLFLALILFVTPLIFGHSRQNFLPNTASSPVCFTSSVGVAIRSTHASLVLHSNSVTSRQASVPATASPALAADHSGAVNAGEMSDTPAPEPRAAPVSPSGLWSMASAGRFR